MLSRKLICAATVCGAHKAVVIDSQKISLSAAFRDICLSNGCGMKNRCWMCPPDCGEIEELMEEVRSYTKALVFQTIYPLEDSFDIEGMHEAKKDFTKLCLSVREQMKTLLTAPFMLLGAGGCHVCEKCSRPDGEPCRSPELAILSLEACGVDVYGTVKDTVLKYTNGANTVTYFGMVLFSE